MNTRLTLALATWMFAAGCSAGPSAGNNAEGECSSSADCAGELVCRLSLCTLAESEPRPLGFRLVPPPSSTYPPQNVPIREIPGDEPVQIGLDPGVRVAGNLTWVGSEAGPGSGRLKFKRRSTDGFAAEAAVENDSYEIYVPAGSYDITFFPGDPERPTRVWSEVKIELDTDPRLQLVRETVEISGTLSRTDAMSRDSATVTGARVFATARDSGVTSSASITGPSGNFRLAVPPDSGVFDLHVGPAQPNTYSAELGAAYIPEATYEEAFAVEDNEWVNLLDENPQADVLGLSLGEYGYAPLSIPFRLALESGSTEVDWTGTAVTLRTAAGRGTVSVRHRVESSGEFELPLVLGLYDAVVRTPPGLPVRSMEISGIELDATGVVLRLQSRTNANGIVLGPSGSPLANTELTFSPIAGSGLAEQVSATTDDSGEYAVWLEDEPYLLTVVPADPGLPRRVLVVRDGDVPDAIEVGEPVLVWGSVFGTPAEGSTDEWRSLGNVSLQVLEQNEDGLEVIVGEGQTNEAGDFKVVIGARP